MSHVRESLRMLLVACFTLNTDKLMLGATEIKYLGPLITQRGIKV